MKRFNLHKPKPIVVRPPLGVKLRRTRERRRLSVDRLAQLSGTNADDIWRTERCERAPTITEIHAWAKVMGLKAIELMP